MIDQEDFDISFVDDEGDDVFQLEEHTFVDQEDLEEVEISFVSDEEEDDENLDETNEEILWPGALVQEDDTERLTRLNVLNVIEASIFEQLNSFITRRGSPAFQFPNFHSKKNVTFVPEHGLRPINWEETPIELSAVKFDVQTSEKKYIRMMHILNKIHELLVNNEFITKRELYYQLLRHDGGTMEQIDEAIQTIVVMLQIPRGHLRILATSKGLVAGNLTFTIDGIEVDCSAASHGEQIPNEVDDMRDITSNAKVVIVVEKDATFQRLMQEKFLQILSENNIDVLLITGKGVPDLSTRKLLHRLANEDLKDAFYLCLVDGDPYGVAIMLIYKYGSMAMAWCCEQLAVPKLEWIGVHPSEFKDLGEILKGLSPADKKKVDCLRSRDYLPQDYSKELNLMSRIGKKAEIEDIESPSRYIWLKLRPLGYLMDFEE